MSLARKIRTLPFFSDFRQSRSPNTEIIWDGNPETLTSEQLEAIVNHFPNNALKAIKSPSKSSSAVRLRAIELVL